MGDQEEGLENALKNLTAPYKYKYALPLKVVRDK
jgi:hypothetical protein